MGVADIAPVVYRDGRLKFLDQTLLPGKEEYIEIKCKEDVWEAIKKLRVRGAPAIGVAAAYGLAVVTRAKVSNIKDYVKLIGETGEYLKTSRPTAVNLAWAVDRMNKVLNDAMRPEAGCALRSCELTVTGAERLMLEEAERIRQEDEDACRAMGEYGLSLLKPGMGILTHCNAGTIATARYGTCLAPIYLGTEKGYNFKVFADETRPLLQGARLTSWELDRAGIDVTLICDNMAQTVMRKGWIDAVVVGCDRMAANGDGANKIGTAGVAILAKEFGIPFYMYVPTSTIDLDTPTGDNIPIELRDGDEIKKMWYREPMAPERVRTFDPSFDVTPAKYITAVITEKGIVSPPYDLNLAKLMGR